MEEGRRVKQQETGERNIKTNPKRVAKEAVSPYANYYLGIIYHNELTALLLPSTTTLLNPKPSFSTITYPTESVETDAADTLLIKRPTREKLLLPVVLLVLDLTPSLRPQMTSPPSTGSALRLPLLLLLFLLKVTTKPPAEERVWATLRDQACIFSPYSSGPPPLEADRISIMAGNHDILLPPPQIKRLLKNMKI